VGDQHAVAEVGLTQFKQLRPRSLPGTAVEVGTEARGILLA
jgi:hypothetical protein